MSCYFYLNVLQYFSFHCHDRFLVYIRFTTVSEKKISFGERDPLIIQHIQIYIIFVFHARLKRRIRVIGHQFYSIYTMLIEPKSMDKDRLISLDFL